MTGLYIGDIWNLAQKCLKSAFEPSPGKKNSSSKMNSNLVAYDVFNLRNEFHAIPTSF